MTNNLMEEYIKITKTNIINFVKLFFDKKYNNKIALEYLSTYIESRMYNFGDTKQKFFYRRIYASLVDKKEEIETEWEKVDKQALQSNLLVYQFIFYIDGVRAIEDINEFVKSVCEKRTTKFGLEEIKGLENKIIKLIKKFEKEKEDFFKSYKTSDFSLNIEKCILIDNTYSVKLDYNFKMPYIYSAIVINEVYNSGVINEDKLIIEYILLCMLCIKDINKGDFATKYLVDFANTLFAKQNKLRQTLRIITNQAMQDKIYLKITYIDFEENKDLIYSLVKEGFRFALILDNSFAPTILNFRKLSIFEYVIVPQWYNNCDKIKEKETKLTNTIIFD